jgi:hypothetical protein
MAECKYCPWTATWQTTHLQAHLTNNYPEYTKKRGLELTLDRSIIISKSPSLELQREFNISVAFSCYFDNLSFNAFRLGKAI